MFSVIQFIPHLVCDIAQNTNIYTGGHHTMSNGKMFQPGNLSLFFDAFECNFGTVTFYL